MDSDSQIILSDRTVDNIIHINDKTKKLLCVEYPGYIKNVDKMIETLGGIRAIEMAASGVSKHLELKFRPNDLFCKPIFGEEDYKTKILIKVTIKKPKSNLKSADSSPDNDCLYKYELEGLTSLNISFKHPCDFQYFPLVSIDKVETSKSKCKNIYDDIIPKTLPDLDWLKSKENIPFFAIPKTLVKPTLADNKLFYDRHEYYEKVFPEYAKRLIEKQENGKEESSDGLVTRVRKARKFYSILVNFRNKNLIIPTAPKEDAVRICKEKGLDQGLEKLKELFTERPIWPRIAIQHKTQIRNIHLKVLLPSVAFYCKNGPWRAMWIKFGYDPRQDPKSLIYQTFDLRISECGLKTKIPTRFNYNHSINSTPKKFSLKNINLPIQKETNEVNENMYILKPDVLPNARQMLYQYCDVQLKDIQDMLAKLPTDCKSLRYHNKNGWLPQLFEDHCREIAIEIITKLVETVFREEKKEKEEYKEEESAETSMEVDDDVPGPSTSQQTIATEEPSIVISDDDDDAGATKNSDDDFPNPNNLTDSEDDEENFQVIMNEIEEFVNMDNEDENNYSNLNNLMKKLWNK